MSNANERILARELLRLNRDNDLAVPTALNIAKGIVGEGPPATPYRDAPVIVTRGLLEDVCTLLSQQPTVIAQRLTNRLLAKTDVQGTIEHMHDNDVHSLFDALFDELERREPRGANDFTNKRVHGPGCKGDTAADERERAMATLDAQIAGEQAHDAERRIAQHAEDGFR